jgi:glycosyltransferase involved in cell wall biosynthesis
MDVSVVIPTCNRRARLLSLLGDLARSSHPIREILIVDSSDEKLRPEDVDGCAPVPVHCIESPERSVCVQRNLGIGRALGEWVFLCDDDVEVPADYIEKLAAHARAHTAAGAVSGLWLEKDAAGRWRSQYPVTSTRSLLYRYVFQLGVWGEIEVSGPLADVIARRYRRRGNAISAAGFPVLVDFSGDYFRTPIYTLGASIVKRTWLIASPYDEGLDAHGIGDNYGVAIGFPPEGIHVVTGTFVRHHKESYNRLPPEEAYARRLMALHYFLRSRRELAHLGQTAFLWSLLGQAAFHAARERRFARAAAATLVDVVRGRNPYLESGQAPRPAEGGVPSPTPRETR